MLRFLRRMPIKRQLMLLASSTGIIIFSVIMFIYLQISSVVAENNHKYTDEYFKQIDNSIVEKCSLSGHILTNIAYNSTVQNFLMETSRINRFEIEKDISNMMINMQDLNKGILDIYIKSEEGHGLYLHGTATNLKGIVDSLPKDVNNFYSEEQTVKFNGHDINSFIIATSVYSINSEKRPRSKIGVVVIVLDSKALGLGTDKEKNSEGPTFFYLLDRNNKVYSTNTNDIDLYNGFSDYASYNEGSYVAYKDGQKYFISKADIPEINGKIISIAPAKLLLADISWMQRLTFMLLLAAAALLAVPFLIIINNILHPVRGLVKFINAIRSGDLKLLKKRLKLEGFEEIEIVAIEFNNMLDEIDKLTQGLVTKSTMLYESELAKKQAELAYLKSQINPHFLYNTLEAMKGCAFDEEAPRTAGMAKALAQIFRYSVKGENTVSLKEELNIVKSYVQIQQMRFDNKFDVSYEFSNEALSCKLPKMLLQPIVENAVFHGLEAKMGKGCLRMEAYIDVMRDMVVIIEDNGIGIDEETLIQINDQLEQCGRMSVQENASIGIFNVNNRIKLTYGDKYGINVYSILDKGTKVILKVPTGEAKV